MKGIVRAWTVAVMMICSVGGICAWGQSPATDLTAVSLEDLMSIEVTSASKKEEKLFQTAAAIYVITQEDIRRSGMTSVPELFRLVPGMDVARIDATKWAVSIRGFNSRYANKLLVLIDGRTIYTPENSGVYWEAKHLPLEEIDRIEVIRGPGGTLWGANAVNGIINIITRHSRETQGGLLAAGGGSEDQGTLTTHYGGRLGERAYYRVYSKYFNRGSQVDAAGFSAHDWQNWVSAGWRMDWKKSQHDDVTFQGDLYDTALRETPTTFVLRAPFAPPGLTHAEFMGGNVMGRWNHVFSDRSDTTLQVYFDRARREFFDFGERIDTFDADFQHHVALGRRQDLIWGLGYRLIPDRFTSNRGTPAQYLPNAQTAQIFSGFVQDELTLVKNRLRLTLGSKLEHNDYDGFEAQPNARLLWTPSTHQTVWAAVSRAVRTPSRSTTGFNVNIASFPGPGGFPVILRLSGDPTVTSEELRAYEFGYRVQPNKRFSLDLATFYNFYDRLGSEDPGLPFPEFDPPPPHLIIPIAFGNQLRGRTYGLEAAANLELTRRWKFRSGYSYLGAELSHRREGQNTNVDNTEGGSPRHQFQFHSYLRLPRGFDLDNSFYHVTRLPAQHIP
ncbi:MAG TPA: TonB-dependent receptor plug domain-containing protein, partial [Blastocatellia bacterium]|nr:TonB-dependent receptor plug domain-containing protein [Blastocatellia bacterium]